MNIMNVEKKYFDTAKTVDLFAELTPSEKAESKLLADIAMIIHNKRIDMGLNQKEFGNLFGVTQTVASRWESGEYNFTLRTLVKVLTELGIRIQLISKEDEERSKEMEIALDKLVTAYSKTKTA